MLFIYSSVTFSKTVILSTFSAKTFIKILFLELNIFRNKYAVRVAKTLKYFHSYVWENVGMWSYLKVCYCQFAIYYKIIRMV